MTRLTATCEFDDFDLWAEACRDEDGKLYTHIDRILTGEEAKDLSQLPLLDAALALSKKAHAGQVDKGGVDYVQHPIRVAARCETDDERIVALLHDTIEDIHAHNFLLTGDRAEREAIEG